MHTVELMTLYRVLPAVVLAGCAAPTTQVEVHGDGLATELHEAVYGVTQREGGSDPSKHDVIVVIGHPGLCDDPNEDWSPIRIWLNGGLTPEQHAVTGSLGLIENQRVSPQGTLTVTDVTVSNLPHEGDARPFAVSGELTGTIDVQLRKVVEEQSSAGFIHYNITDEVIGSAAGRFVATHCGLFDVLIIVD